MFNIKSLARMAICTALIVVCSWLTVPFTVPNTRDEDNIVFMTLRWTASFRAAATAER